MLIKVKVNPNDTLTTAPHTPANPLDRRTFIKGTLNTMGILLVAPNILSAILSSRAFAADVLSLTSAPEMSYTALELIGGAGLSKIFAPFRQDGSSFAGNSNAVLGFSSNTAFSGSLIKGLQVNMTDPFYQCMRRGGKINSTRARPGEDSGLISDGEVDRVMNCVSGTLFASPSMDDFTSNPQSAIPALQMVRTGAITKTLRVGDTPNAAYFDGGAEKETVVFGGADPGDTITQKFGCPGDVGKDCYSTVIPSYFPTSSGSLNDLVGSVALANDTGIGSADASMLQEAAKAMMRDQEGLFKSMSGAKGFFENLFKSFEILPERANYNGMISKLSLDSPDLSGVKAMFQNTSQLGTIDRKKVIASAANARGMIGSMSVVETGFDYHFGNGLEDYEYPHQLIARNILLWAATHVALGKEGFLHIYTDGSMSWNGDRPVGDNGSISLVVVLHVKPSGNPANLRPLNHFTPSGGGAGEAASPNHLVASTPGHSGMAALVTYLKITGHLNNNANIDSLLSVYGSRFGLDRAKLLTLNAVG